MISLAGYTPTRMVLNRLDRIDPRGTWAELALAINRSRNFPDVDDLDIRERLEGHPRTSRIADLDRGLISDLAPTRIMEHTRRTACFAAPSDAQIDFELHRLVATSDTPMIAGIVFGSIPQRTHTDLATSQVGYDPQRTRMLTTSGALEIATICEITPARLIQGVALPGSSFVYRAGSTLGIRIEPTLMEGEITRLARMRDRTHISADNLIVDFGQFRTTLEIFSHFLADKEVVIFGP